MNARYFQYSLAWPIVLPLALWLINAALGTQSLARYVPDPIMVSGFILVGSLLFGGLPYLGCWVWAHRKLKGATAEQAVRFWWRLPAVFWVVEFVCLALVLPVFGALERDGWEGIAIGVFQAGFLSLFVLPVGCFYSLLVVGGYRLGHWLHARLSGKRSSWCLGCD